MALFRPNLQISSQTILNSKAFINFIENTASSCQNTSGIQQKFFWSWFRKEEEKPTRCRSDHVFYESSCRRRLPECPEHIGTGAPSRCLEEGYGKPIKQKRRSWFSFSKAPVVIKEKPSNCKPRSPCKKEISFAEYICGPKKPLPDPRTCRMAYKLKQMRNVDDPRLEDPRYQVTKGDVLLYSEPQKLEVCPKPGRRPKAPTPHRPPNAVICKRVAESVAALDCYCACAPVAEDEPCRENLCPVHSKPFRLPYEELRPHNARRKFFTCAEGIAAEDVSSPPRSESCNCIHPVFANKLGSFPPPHEDCACNEALQLRSEAVGAKERERGEDGPDDSNGRMMSRCERLTMITRNRSDVNIPKFLKKTSCESRCSSSADCSSSK